MSVIEKITSSRYSFPIFIFSLLSVAGISLAVVWYGIASIERDRVAHNSDVSGELLLRCRKADCYEGVLVNFLRDENARPSETSVKFLTVSDLASVSKVLGSDEHFSDFAGVLSIDLLGACEALSGDLQKLTRFKFDALPRRRVNPESRGHGQGANGGAAGGFAPHGGNFSFENRGFDVWEPEDPVADSDTAVHSCRARFFRSEEEHGGWLYRTKILAWIGIKVFV